MPPYIERITHYVDTEDYTVFIHRLRGILAQHDDLPRQFVRDNRNSIHYVLPKQKHPRAPERWIYIKLVLRDGEETTLAVRDDNVYLIGFKNKREELFEFGFSGTIDRSKKSRPMLRGSRFLECDVNYGSLLHGGARNLVKMWLDRGFARWAVLRLSGYAQGQGGIVDDNTRRALAGLMVMVCEATRMRPLLERAGWHANARCCCIDSEHVDYIWGWGDMSEALLRWKRDPDTFQFPECLKDIGVGGAGKALDIVELLLNTPIHRDPTWRGDRWRQRPAAGDDDARRSEQQRREGGDRGRPSEKQRPAAGEDGSGSGQQQSPPNKRRRTEQQHDQDQPQEQQQPPPPPSDKGSGESQHSHQQETPPVSPADDYVACGRPLVEVFAVRAGFHFVGTIAVFDGMRGQVIYENENNGGAPPIHGSSSRSAGDDDQGYAPLLLTGPYRAISAYGSFTIEVDIRGAEMAAQQDQGADGGELNWDCYDTDKVYDRPVTETITTSRSGRMVKVTYAVLSDAVDAELKVHLRLPGATAEGRGAVVYGRIATRSKAFHDEDLAWSVLFDSEEVEGVSLVADGPGSIARLPLARSVVAMPLGSPLVIMATLYDAPPSQHGVSPVFQCQDMELTLDDRMRRRSADNGGEFEVSITSPDRYPRPRRNDTATPRRTPTSHYGCS
ncbi:60 kDa jasmonate-induced protein-like [Miscanthus floridulus]|uniref:60 kDa jasmonate-induced protein-like n=1 Tax=Miscanthus floridulus TaxID=154761 RepID=UPI00345783AD